MPPGPTKREVAASALRVELRHGKFREELGRGQRATTNGAQVSLRVRENREKFGGGDVGLITDRGHLGGQLRCSARTPLFDIAQDAADRSQRLAIGRLEMAGVARIAGDRHFAMESVERAVAPPALEKIVRGA